MLQLKVRKVGNSLGMVLPKEAATNMNISEGDNLYLTETPEGGYRLTPEDPNFALQMEAAQKLIKRYRNTLRELAK